MTHYTTGNITFAPRRSDPWPTSDREWARGAACDPSTCTNGKCNQTGECIDRAVAKQHREIAERHTPGLFAGLTNDQKAAALAYRGPDSHSPPRTLVAFTGLAGAGKSTAAAHLVKRHGYQRVRFAGPLKAMMAALGLSTEQIDGSEKEIPCDLLGGRTPRHAMQTLGTEWGRDLIAPDLWIRAWQAAVAKVPPGTPIVVDDCRFPNEVAAIRAAGGVIVRIERPGAGTASVHQSEQHQLEADQTIRNIADEQLLRDEVDILVTDLSWREVA